MGRPKIGFLAGNGGNHTGIGQYFQLLDAVGIPALSASYDNYGVIQELDLLGQASGVDHMLAFHSSVTPANPDYNKPAVQAAQEFYALNKAVLPPEFNKARVKWILANEGDAITLERARWWGDWALETSRLCEVDGIKPALWGWSAGTPYAGFPGDPFNFWEVDTVKEWLQYASEHGHMVAVHEGGDPRYDGDGWPPLVTDPAEGITQRYHAMWDVCDAMGIERVGIIVTEFASRYDGFPPLSIGLPQLKEAAEVYGKDGVFVAVWKLFGGQEHGDVYNDVQPYIAPITEYTLNTVLPDPDPPPEPPPLDKVIIIKVPQLISLDEYLDVARVAYAGDGTSAKMTTTFAHTDMLRMLDVGREDSYAWIAYPQRQLDVIQFIEDSGHHWQPLILDDEQDPLEGLVLAVPLDAPWEIVDGGQFNAPRNYANGLHEGLDFATSHHNANVTAPIDGVIEAVAISNVPGGGYGQYVRMGAFYQGHKLTLYLAHMDEGSPTVGPGDIVTQGAILGNVGSSGNATGVHVHLTVSSQEFGLPGYVSDIMPIDPSPYMDWNQPPAPLPKIDLLNYLRGDGRCYMVRHPDGSEEKFRTVLDGGRWRLLKNSQYEEFYEADGWIWRTVDTSPGPAPSYSNRPGQLRYYTQKETGKAGARWIRRLMAVGETFVGFGHIVSFHFKSDCAFDPANSGAAINTTALIAHHDSLTFNGITIPDVVEIGGGEERFFFAKNFSLIAWQSSWGSSAISKILPPGECDNSPEQGCWG